MLTYEEVVQILVQCGSEDRAEKFVNVIAPNTDDATLKRALVEFWTVTEAWGGSDTRHGILEILNRVGYVSDTKKKPRLDRKYPGYGIVEIWRGNIGEDPREGFCWTTEMATAEFFARHPFSIRGAFLGLGRDEPFGPMKEGAVATVWRGWVYRDDILGYFTGREEHEVIVNGDDIIQYDWYSRSAPVEKESA
jgi:hypothetical protein